MKRSLEKKIQMLERQNKSLTDKLYVDESDKGKGNKNNLKIKLDGDMDFVATEGPTAIELAYLIKTTEELGRDCDDAERLLTVIYETFHKMCAYRATGEELNDRFITVYKQQLDKVFCALAGSKFICRTGSNCRSTFGEFVSWINSADAFKTIPTNSPIDGYGKVRREENYKYDAVPEINSVLKFNFVAEI